MNSRRQFIFAGLQQAGLVFVALLAVSLFGALLLWYSQPPSDATGSFRIAISTVALPMLAVGGSILAGPVPAILTLFDLTDRQIIVLSCVLVIPYWALLGGGVGEFMRRAVVTVGADQLQVAIPKPAGKSLRWKVEIAALVIAVAALPFGPIVGSLYGSGSRFYSPGRTKNSVINNLRQIDGAKQQFALEKNLPPDYVPTEADLIPYLASREIPHVGGERYVLNQIDTPPYAVLDSDWRFRRRGWHEGFTIPQGTVYQLP